VHCQTLAGVRYRAALFRQRAGLSLAIRLMPPEPPPLDKLQLPAPVAELGKLQRGLVLIGGPLGSGKTTTLNALLMAVAATRPSRIMVLERAAEIVPPTSVGLCSRRLIGTHTTDLACALRSALRSDLDILVIDELSGKDATDLALQIAQTGKLVLAAVRGNQTIRILQQMVSQFPRAQQVRVRLALASTLRGVVVQHLIPGIDQRRRLPATEILSMSPAIASLLRQDAVAQIRLLMELDPERRSHTLDQSLLELHKDHRIRIEELAERIQDKSRLLKALAAKEVTA
jgi:twitching motility protein PilT